MVSKKPKGLGRGLEALLGPKVSENAADDSATSSTSPGPSDAEIQAQIDQRQAAKAAKDFPAADSIRDGLRAQGIELIDRPGGITEWLRR